MAAALEGVSLPGRVLAAGVGGPVVEALRASGAEVDVWRRFYTPGGSASAVPPEGPFDRIACRLPRGRRALEAMTDVLAARLAPGGTLWIYGGNDEGIRSASRTLGARFSTVETVDARKHGRVLAASGVTGTPRELDAFAVEVVDRVGDREVRFSTLPGVFADGRLDTGTRRLLEHLHVAPGARVLDVGCGAGAIGVFLGDPTRWVGLDVDAWALRCADRNLPGGETRFSDVGSAVRAGERFEHVVSNPPLHDGDRVDPRPLEALIAGASDWLRPGGRLTFVAPATSAVRRALEDRFSNVELLHDDRSTRVWEATR